MGYLHIRNLSAKDQDILLFKEAFAMEKVHGTSTHISWDGKEVKFFSGGTKYENFIALFDKDKLIQLFTDKFGPIPVTIYGEGAGGKEQGMSATYGKNLFFIAFDVKVNNSWLSVPQAENVVQYFELEFVPYHKISVNLESLNCERDRPSEVAIRRGCGDNKIREGIVVRPLQEFTKSNSERVILKHKRPEFGERKAKIEKDTNGEFILTEARKIADECVVMNRLNNILSHHPEFIGIENTSDVIKTMLFDIKREAQEEGIVKEWTKEIDKQIGHNTVILYKEYLKHQLLENK